MSKPEIQYYPDRPGIFAIQLPDGRWQDFDIPTLAAEWVHYRNLARNEDFGLAALNSLHDYFDGAQNFSAKEKIEQAAHLAGFCLDHHGERIDPELDCPFCCDE